MAKIILNDITNVGQVSVINDNFDRIQNEFQNKVLYRVNPVGEPNTMDNDLDVDGFDVYNVGTLSANNIQIDGVDIDAVVADVLEAEANAEADANRAEAAAELAEAAAELAEAAAAEAASIIAPTAFADYDDLRAYTGSAAQATITGYSLSASPSGIAGIFTKDDTDVVSADNGGTIIVSSDGTRWKRTYSGYINVQWFGAKGDGITDDSASISAAMAIGGGIYFPPATYRIALPVTVSVSCHLLGAGPDKSKILVDLPNTGGKCITILSDNVSVEGLEFTATGITGTLSANMYALFAGNGITKYNNHTFHNLKFTDLTRSDGLSDLNNLLVHHALYIDNVDNVTIDEFHVDMASGAGLFCRDNVGLWLRNFKLVDCQWYCINFDAGVENFIIADGSIDCQLPTGVYWGGGINLMSQVGEGRCKHGLIERIVFTGVYSYGTVVRILSSEDITLRDFTIKDWSVGTWAASADISAVRADTRGISTAAQNGPCQNIRIYNYDIEAPTTAGPHRGIYCGNLFQTARTPFKDIFVGHGQIKSTDTTYYFSEGIIFQGGDGGIQGVRVRDNHVTTVAQAAPTVGGAIGFVSNSANGGVTDVWIGGNELEDLGTPATSAQVGISIGAYTDRVVNESPNRITNYWYNVRTLTNSGPSLENLDAQNFGTVGSANTLFNVALSWYGRPLVASTTWDPGSIADGDSETKQLTGVTGAVVGDFVDVSFSLDVQDLGISATVAAAGIVEVVLQNNSGAARDLASGTVYVRVHKRGTAG